MFLVVDDNKRNPDQTLEIKIEMEWGGYTEVRD